MDGLSVKLLDGWTAAPWVHIADPLVGLPEDELDLEASRQH